MVNHVSKRGPVSYFLSSHYLNQLVLLKKAVKQNHSLTHWISACIVMIWPPRYGVNSEECTKMHGNDLYIEITPMLQWSHLKSCCFIFPFLIKDFLWGSVSQRMQISLQILWKCVISFQKLESYHCNICLCTDSTTVVVWIKFLVDQMNCIQIMTCTSFMMLVSKWKCLCKPIPGLHK